MANTAVLIAVPGVVAPVTPSAFTNSNGVATDPDSVVCVVTDPDGTASTYVYGSGEAGDLNDIYKISTGKYELDLQGNDTLKPGLWHTTWVGTGGGVASGVQILSFGFRILGQNTLGGQNRWYIGLEELKSRLGVVQSSTSDDYEMSMAIQAATAYINRYCATHFYQVTEARTFAPGSIYTLPVDQFVHGSITEFLLDYDGDFVFETPWDEGINYQTYREGHSYNPGDIGVLKPDDYVQVLLGSGVTVAGGQFFPFVWPFTHDDRVKITATWGWPEIPVEVHHACMLLSTQLFKEKDAPWGVVGMSDLGAVRVQQSPWLVDMLRPYIFSRKKIGI